VYVEEVDRGSKPIEGVGTAVAAFVGFTAKAPDDDPADPDGIKPRLVTNWSQYERLFGGFVEGALLPHAVYGYFANGGGTCFVVRVPSGIAGAVEPKAMLPSGAKEGLEVLKVTALEPGARVEVEIEPGPAEEGKAPETFAFKVRVDGREVEAFPDLTFGKGARNVETVVNEQSAHVRVAAPRASGATLTERIPGAGRYQLEVSAPKPVRVSDKDFEGSESARTGIRGLVIAEDVTMLAVPDLVTAVSKNGDVDLDMFKAVQTAMITHCELAGTRMAILDSPPGMNPQQIKEWREGVAMYDSKFAALYYPWITVANPLAGGNGSGDKLIDIPPCGHIAGIWARNDDTRGVWKAPANEVVRGALNVDFKVTKGEQDLLNPNGINCIRPFGTRGIRVWGGRTITSDPAWRYVNVRRLFNFIEESILRGTQWVVFEPNDIALWQRVKRTIYAFLLGLWRQGALAGATPAQAFYVKCDEETNPPESVDEGKLVVEVGLAPVKPAEFVIFRISQWQGGGGATE
jgi:phage tail sheath protein FI